MPILTKCENLARQHAKALNINSLIKLKLCWRSQMVEIYGILMPNTWAIDHDPRLPPLLLHLCLHLPKSRGFTFSGGSATRYIFTLSGSTFKSHSRSLAWSLRNTQPMEHIPPSDDDSSSAFQTPTLHPLLLMMLNAIEMTEEKHLNDEL